MKRIILTISILLFSAQYSTAHELAQATPKCLQEPQNQEELILPNIFIYSDTPEFSQDNQTEINNIQPAQEKTSKKSEDKQQQNIRYDDSSVARYNFSLEDEEAVELSDINYKSLNLHNQQTNRPFQLCVSQNDYKNRGVMPFTYKREEYSILPMSKSQVEKAGNFEFGTMYNSGIDTSQLEYKAGLFTRYEHKRFAISTAYQKNQMTAHGLTTDNFYLAPEFKLNNSISISSVMKADTTRNRRSNEFVLTIKPFAYKGNDRVNLEFGAGQTYDENNELFKTQFRFNTRIKL